MTVGADSLRIALGYWLDRVAAGEDALVTRRGKPMIRLTAVASPPVLLTGVAQARRRPPSTAPAAAGPDNPDAVSRLTGE